MRIYEDKANKEGKHLIKNEWWQKNKIDVVRVPLPVGDYVLENEKIADVIVRKAKRCVELKKMDFMGCYNISVDSKQSIQELIGDFQAEHERFRDELLLAKNNGIRLYIVVENEFQWISQKKNIFNEPIKENKELFRWKNPRAFIFKKGKQAYPNCAKGAWLAKCCITMEHKYGCKFVFCSPEDSARIITEILEGRYAGG